MTRFVRVRSMLFVFAAATLLPLSRVIAQDTTFRGITLVGAYDPLRDKFSTVVLPVAGAFGDSVRAIVQRDLDFTDRFTIVPVDTSDPAALRGSGAGGLNYGLFSRLSVAVIVQITSVASGLHVAMHDVAKGQVVNVGEFALPSSGLNRDWRMAVHRVSDEITRWATGQRGIAATRVAYVRGTGDNAAIRVVDSDGADEITVPTDACGLSPAWNPTATLVAYTTCGASSRLYVIDLTNGRSRGLLGPTRNVSYSTPIFAPGGSSLLYTRIGEDGGADIYSVGVAGGDTPRRLTVGRGVQNSSPTASPDGARIVYVGNALGRPELYIMDADGTNAEVLTNYEDSEKNYRSDPDWSPDGRLIAYQEMLNGKFQVRTIKPSGTAPKYLTSEGENEQPSWAPDGRHLVFTSTRSGVRQLWVMDTESGRTRQLTKAAGSRLAAWSPRIAVP
jgi:TolB protein